nr:hypothetical protein [Planococcus salinarum]
MVDLLPTLPLLLSTLPDLLTTGSFHNSAHLILFKINEKYHLRGVEPAWIQVGFFYAQLWSIYAQLWLVYAQLPHFYAQLPFPATSNTVFLFKMNEKYHE